MIEEARITALAAEYPSDTTASIFTGPPKTPAARSHKRKAAGAPRSTDRAATQPKRTDWQTGMLTRACPSSFCGA